MSCNMRVVLIVVLGFFSLGFDSDKTYQPDLSLKQNWTEERENTLHLTSLPYSVEYVTPDKRLIVGLLSNQPDHKDAVAEMKHLIKQERPNVILDQSKIDPGTKALLAHLEQYGYTAEDLGYYQAVEILNQFYGPRMRTPQDLLKKTEHVMSQINRNSNLRQKKKFSIEKMQHWFYTKTGTPFTVANIKRGELVAPTGVKGTEYLQVFSSRMNEVQDKYFLELLAQELNKKQNKTIAVFRAGSKFITEGPVLTKMMGVAPTIFFKKNS